MPITMITTRTRTVEQAAAELGVPEDEARIDIADVGFRIGGNDLVPVWAIEAVKMRRRRIELDLEFLSTRDQRKRDCRVYFIRAGALIKIGASEKPEKRLIDLQIANPQQLTLIGHMPGDEAVERRLHRKFARLRERGEWFRGTPALLRYIAENCG